MVYTACCVTYGLHTMIFFARVYVYECVHTCAGACGRQGTALNVIPQSLLPYCVAIGLVADLDLTM